MKSPQRGAELIAVLVVILFEPAGTDTEDEAPARDDVHGPCHVREQLRVAIRVACHQRADLDVFGRLGPGAKHRPAFEVFADGGVTLAAVEGVEVVPVIEHVHADLFGFRSGFADIGIVCVLRVDLNCDTDVGHRSPLLAPVTIGS